MISALGDQSIVLQAEGQFRLHSKILSRRERESEQIERRRQKSQLAVFDPYTHFSHLLLSLSLRIIMMKTVQQNRKEQLKR